MKKPRVSLATFLSLDIGIGVLLMIYWSELPPEFAYSVAMAIIFSILGQIGQISRAGPKEALGIILKSIEFAKSKGGPAADTLNQIENFIMLAMKHWDSLFKNGVKGAERHRDE
jgi:hypothetical protein